MKSIIQYLQSDETKKSIIAFIEENFHLYKGISTEVQIKEFTGLVYNQFVKECVRNNQYVSLSNKTISLLDELYNQLNIDLLVLSNREYDYEKLASIVENHRQKLIVTLQSNEYDSETEQLFIPCAEYSFQFQDQILRLSEHFLKEPIIDIGCGATCQLVGFLRKNGYSEVYGLDQFVSNDSKIICSNWFDFKFRESSWSTIIAHMSFSNHLRRSLINNDDKKAIYVGKYHEILKSLNNNGLFIYTPSVKILEEALNPKDYEVTYYKNLKDSDLDTVYVKKLMKF